MHLSPESPKLLFMITKVLIIGAGAIAHLHAKAALKLNPVPKIAAADPNAASRESFFTAFPGSLMFESAETMLAEPNEGTEVVIVATPPFLHCEHGLAGLRSGRHVLVEKPTALNPAEAEALASEARALGLELACCSSRFSARPITAEIRRRLGTGELGKGLRVLWQVRVNGDINGLSYQPQSRWFLDRSKAGGGTLFDWGCYDLAVWSEIFQPVGITVDAAWTGHPRRGEDVPEGVVFDVEHQVAAQLRLHLGDGTEVPVSYERASVCHGIGSTLTQIEGDRGALNWDWLGWDDYKIRLRHASGPGEALVDEVTGPDDEGLDCHDRPLHALAAKLAGRESCGIDGDRAVFHLRVLDAIYEVARTGRAVTVDNELAPPVSQTLLGSQMYPAWQAYSNLPGGYEAHFASVLRAHAKAGFDAWELSLTSDAVVAELLPLLAETGLKIPSIYVGAKLHTPDWQEGVERILESARRAGSVGASVVVCNPDPVSWETKEDKTDDELRTQVKALQIAGEKLHELGVRFAYHWHDPEFRCGAREVWSMLLNTDPRIVEVCFDTHWTYRGAGNSQEAMFDMLEFTLPRIASFHIRQSQNGVWSEAFGEGDIDYRRWAARLKKARWTGPIHLEQATEAGTPKTMDILEAQAQGLRYLRELLA